MAFFSEQEDYYGGITNSPTSTGTGSCTFDFRSDVISTSTGWVNVPSNTGFNYSLMGIKDLYITNDAGWADGTDQYLFNFAGVTVWARKNGSQWQIYATDGTNTQLGNTLLEFGSANKYNISMSSAHASPYPRRIWVGNTLEINFNGVITGSAAIRIILGSSTQGTAAGSFTVEETFTLYTDTDERMDAASLDGREMVPTSGTPMHDEYADWTNEATEAKYQQMDEDPPDDNTSYLENPATANSTFRQTYLTTNATLANVEAIKISQRGKATVADKTLTIYSISGDGTNKEEVNVLGPLTTNYTTTSNAIFNRAPDTGVWSQTDLDNLEIGVRWTIGAEAVTWRQTSMECEAMGVDFISAITEQILTKTTEPPPIVGAIGY